MRRAARTDSNHSEIVAALRSFGASVRSLASVGQGMPDLLVGIGGRNVLLEVKDGAKPPSARRLTPDEQHFFDSWTGQVAKVESVDEALRAIGLATTIRRVQDESGAQNLVDSLQGDV